MGASRERYYSSQDGLALFYREYGDPLAPSLPVLCLPGLTRNSTDFIELARRLAPSRHVLCPDYRGRGRSAHDSNWRNYTAANYANDMRHLLALSGTHRVIVVGTSMGGLLAMILGTVLPSAIAGVVLNDVGPDVEDEGAARILRYIAKDRPQPDWTSAIDHMKNTLPFLKRRSEADWRRAAEGTYREGEDGQLHFDWDIDLVRPLLTTGEGRRHFWQEFRALRRLPVLVVRGALSDILTEDCVRRMAVVHSGLISVEVAETGHVPLLNEPEAVSAIDDFLACF